MKQQLFVTIDAVSEVPEGSSVRVHSGEKILLRRDNDRFGRIAELFASALALSQRHPWPVQVIRSPDGSIETARAATRARILGISEEPDGSCRVGFAFIPTVKQLRPEHPEFARLEETLLAAAATGQEVFYTEVAGSESVLDDVALASADKDV
jgi:hypothetical protein